MGSGPGGASRSRRILVTSASRLMWAILFAAAWSVAIVSLHASMHSAISARRGSRASSNTFTRQTPRARWGRCPGRR